MKDDEVCLRLGLPNLKELKRILCKQTHNICTLHKNRMSYDSEHQVVWLPNPTNSYLFKNIQKVDKKGIKEISSIFTHKAKGWKVILSLENPRKYEDQDLVKCKETKIPSNQDLEDLERGHLLADLFSKAIIINHSIPKSNGTYTSFFSKKNSENIILEFKRTNEGTNGCYTQQYFEIKLNNWLKMNDFVYYEIQAIYARQFDVIPIGIRMLGYSASNPKKLFHVFVPNYSRRDYRDVFQGLDKKV